jgi:hypothetical protein
VIRRDLVDPVEELALGNVNRALQVRFVPLVRLADVDQLRARLDLLPRLGVRDPDLLQKV